MKKALYADPELKKLVDEWYEKGRQSEIRKAADHVFNGGGYEFLEGMEKMASFAGQDMPTVLFAHVQTSILFFRADSVEEVAKKLGPLKDKVVLPTPKKVLVKMVLLRYNKIKKELKDQEKWGDKLPEPLIFGPIRSREELLDFQKKVVCLLGHQYRSDRIEEAINEILGRETIDDEILSAAWDATVCREVMDA